jgi:nicotinamidase-related amidase
MGASSLPYGPLTTATIHLCIDMQQMFAEPTPWHVPWMKRVMPTILKIARAWPARTAFTRFVPPLRAADAQGAWRRYYQRWDEFTGERVDPRYVALLPEFLELVPPAVVIDKDSVVITGGETDVCVLAAVLDAVDLGYRVVLASDALCSVSDKAHGDLLQLFSERFQQQIEVASSEVILKAWL